MTRTVTLVVGSALIVGVGGLVYWQKQEAREQAAALQAAQEAREEMGNISARSAGTNPNTGTSEARKSITLSEVAQHTTRTSCWSTINGGVYDLTSWIPRHPGGEQAILSICGIDGSAKFNAQHGGAALQQQILAGFKIGTLAK